MIIHRHDHPIHRYDDDDESSGRSRLDYYDNYYYSSQLYDDDDNYNNYNYNDYYDNYSSGSGAGDVGQLILLRLWLHLVTGEKCCKTL